MPARPAVSRIAGAGTRPFVDAAVGANRGTATSDDGRWIEIDGRRWRATDPAVASPFRSELVHELMRARRAVRAARTPREVDAARRAVHRAKVALGERGEPWWEPTDAGRRTRLAATALALATHRAPDGSICPSDVARAVGGPGWRTALEPTRDVVRALAEEGAVEVRQRGEVVDPTQPWKGPVRIRATPTTASASRLDA